MMVKIALLIVTCIIFVAFTKAELKGFIIGGFFSKIEDFPHSVLIITRETETSGYNQCGASILNQAILLTAAHCLHHCKERRCIIAFFGSALQYKGSLSHVASYKKHEQYDEKTLLNDVCLLKLEKKLAFGNKVKRIIIMKNPPKGTTAEIAGWGRQTRVLRSFGERSLKHATQQVYDRETCKTFINSMPVGAFCGRGRSFPEKGDSGSALVVKNRTIQIGIASFKVRSRSNKTSVFTDVAYHYNWIMDNARQLNCEDKET